MKTKNILKQFQERVTYLLNNKRISIRTKIFVIVGLFVAFNILINLLIVKVSINDIYLGLEKKELKKQYALVKKNINDQEALLNIIYDANDNGIKIKILNNNYNITYSIFNDKFNNQFTNIDLMVLSNLENKKTNITILGNERNDGYNLHFAGKLDNGFVIMYSSVESLKNDARTSMVIILITSLFTFGILILIAYFISKVFGNKVNELKEVTSNISNLKFDKKIVANSNDELGDLFNNINKMSDSLEENIKMLECANNKLKEDLMEKEKQENARKQLVANISHEFKTPLTIISGYSQLIKEDIKEEEHKESLNKIIEETERLSALVYEFLELSKLESGKIILEKELINFDELVQKELEKLNVNIKKKKLNISFQKSNIKEVLADKKQITKVIINLLTNAIKFCDNKKIIKIKTYAKDEYFYYEVFNTCKKLNEKDLKNIFNSYYKEKSTRNKHGTGLGLTIVNAIVNLHSGSCNVINREDGISFIIKIKRR